ncbi:ferrous iron transport protein A [Nakamurella antarctica]|uniref:Ferrous iron transport protein A n=1 Tax=Nakamurella antarctica TaxID=1902245 RepID=A0A3G9A176_9ACTN|nr:ferrous iron transport protein A [Nakamurella antarctica]
MSVLGVGARVVIRYRIEGGFTDALGNLTELDERFCTVATKRDEVRIDLSRVVATKGVPPPPTPRSRREAPDSGS